jgi:lysosomal acid lipase/cholesteryl ester hydrolase
MRAEHWITWFGGSWALPLQMVDQGFDVWLGNNRGNRSGRHQYLSPEYNPQSYWDYSFAEMGTLDLPAMVQFILKVTSVEKLTYIGYS